MKADGIEFIRESLQMSSFVYDGRALRRTSRHVAISMPKMIRPTSKCTAKIQKTFSKTIGTVICYDGYNERSENKRKDYQFEDLMIICICLK